MKPTINLLDVVALIEDIPAKNLQLGQVGTVVELLEQNFYEVEFVDNDGKTYATLALPGDKLIVLHYHPVDNAGRVFVS